MLIENTLLSSFVVISLAFALYFNTSSTPSLCRVLFDVTMDEISSNESSTIHIDGCKTNGSSHFDELVDVFGGILVRKRFVA